MNNKLKCIAIPLLLITAFLSSCITSTSPVTVTSQSSGPLNVSVSIVPQKYFVERIGGDYVFVNVMVEPGASPATYEPKPEQLTALSKSVVYFSIGVPFEEAWIGRIASANEEILIIDTTDGIVRVPIDAHYKVELGGNPESDAEGRDPHIWLSPVLVKTQVQTIYNTLAELDPSNEVEYKANLENFLADIDLLEADITDTLEGIKCHKFMVFHPAWGYFGDDFELEMIPIEIGGQEPSAAELTNLINEAKDYDIQVIFAQPEFSTKDAETIAAEIGGEVLLISPLAPDWLENLYTVANTFAEILGE